MINAYGNTANHDIQITSVAVQWGKAAAVRGNSPLSDNIFIRLFTIILSSAVYVLVYYTSNWQNFIYFVI